MINEFYWQKSLMSNRFTSDKISSNLSSPVFRSLILGDEKSLNDPNNGVKFMTLDHSNNTVKF